MFFATIEGTSESEKNAQLQTNPALHVFTPLPPYFNVASQHGCSGGVKKTPIITKRRGNKINIEIGGSGGSNAAKQYATTLWAFFLDSLAWEDVVFVIGSFRLDYSS